MRRIKHQSAHHLLVNIFPYLGVMLLIFTLAYLAIKMYFLYQYTVESKQQNRELVSGRLLDNPSPHAQYDRQANGQKWHIKAKIISLPNYRQVQQAWYFTIRPIAWLRLEKQPQKLPPDFPRKIRLSWHLRSISHGSLSEAVPKLGEVWHFWIKLKPIHSYANLGSFDYEKWAFVNGIESRAYVLNQHDKYAEGNRFVEADQSAWIGWVDRWRNDLQQRIDNSQVHTDAKALLKALMIGDKSSLSTLQWDTFRDAGIAHVLAISGLHIGLVMLFMSCLCSRLWRLSVSLCRLISAPYIGFVGGLLTALVYALLSGFDIPVQRALIMVAMIFITLLTKRYIPNLVILFFAFIAVLLFDIRSFYATGFWLSFVSVAMILFLLRRGGKKRMTRVSLKPFHRHTWLSSAKAIGHNLSILLKLQCAITIGLIPLLLFFFQTTSVVSPIANLIITPLIGMMIIPPIIVAILLSPWSMAFNVLVELIGVLLLQLNDFLVILMQSIDLRIQLPSPSIWVTIITTIMLIFIFNTASWKKRLTCLLMTTMLLYPYTKSIPLGTAKVTVLDVGQGLSVVVFTQHHSLIYDFGHRGLGRTVVYPFMRAHLREADTTIISHHDIDHYGGANDLFVHYPNTKHINWKNCNSQWQWDQVSFQLWQYPISDMATKPKDNNQSCVLKITAVNGQSVLLTADIEEEAEQWLIAHKRESIASDILLIPHQGSKTSSTLPFIRAVNPKIALVSAGLDNPFRHPHPSILRRYNQYGIPVYSTICGGMLSIDLGTDAINEQSINQYRKQQGHFWLRQCL